MKLSAKVLILIFLLSSLCFAQSEISLADSKIFKNAEIKINFLDLPGKDLKASKWEIAYELHLIENAEFMKAVEAGAFKYMNEDKQRFGEVIDKGSFSKTNLSDEKNRTVTLSFPLNENLQAQLKKHFAAIVPANIERSDSTKELFKKQWNESQIFLFYATALIYDAKLKKNIVTSFSWILPVRRHTDGKVELYLEIKENGGINIRCSFVRKGKIKNRCYKSMNYEFSVYGLLIK
jgi:hypothetical protein